MKRINATLILILFVNLVSGQNQANNWYFGDYAGITFNTNPPSILPGSAMLQSEGCASISDNSGNLLFYSHGWIIFCSDHSIMPNSIGLTGNSSTTQSCIIIPHPGNASLYYIITVPEAYVSAPLAYSIIDMTLNNGLGAVTVKNSPLLLSSTEKITAVRHQNGIDTWIIAREYPGNNFHAFLITASGINTTPIISSSGISATIPYNKIGYLKASPCGNKLAAATNNLTNSNSFVELFDFNNQTGIVSNGLLLGSWNVLVDGAYGVEFSPDNTKLYTSIYTNHEIVQYNLLAGSSAAIIASQVTIATPLHGCGALQIGPDGKIYVAMSSSVYMGSINFPNQSGLACNFVENSLSIAPASCLYGLPNFLTSLFCNIPSGLNSSEYEHSISVYPDPFINEISISIQNQNFKQTTFIIKNIVGQTMFYETEKNTGNSSTKTIDLSFLSKGVYLLEWNVDGERIVKKIVKA